MSVLLVMGFIAAKAANGNPPELILVSQPVIVYNYNSVTVCYDVQNIGDVADKVKDFKEKGYDQKTIR